MRLMLSMTECLHAFEIEIIPTDLEQISKNVQGWSILLSKKMMEKLEKGMEKQWTQMDLQEIKGLKRSLAGQDMEGLDPSTVAAMRRVLTVKSDDTAKARLCRVRLPNRKHHRSGDSSPTMERMCRYFVLAFCTKTFYKLKAGDVTAAFLQADGSLESPEMTVRVPAELAVLLGTEPTHPVMPLRIRKAFYRLVQSPRCLFIDVSNKMASHGWRCLLADRCMFVLQDDKTNEVIAASGLHVDDALL